jgi:hypothetical protein
MKYPLIATLLLSTICAVTGCGSDTPEVKQDAGAKAVASPTDPMVQKIRAAKLAAKKNAD